MRSQPGRTSLTLRMTVSCAVIIIVSMTLHIPFLAVSLLVVFYADQSNSVLTAIIATGFFVAVTLAIICSLLILKFAFEYPLVRLICSSALFFIFIYLLRIVNRAGLAFLPVALVVIYVQTFPAFTDQAEIIVRLILWAWIAVIYAVGVTVFINFCFRDASPAHQFRQLCIYLLAQIQTTLQHISHSHTPLPCFPSLYDVAKWQTQLETLLKLATSTSPGMKDYKTAYTSHMSAVLRLYNAIAQLYVSPVADKADQQQAGKLGGMVADYRHCFSALPAWKKGFLKPPAASSSHIVLHEIEKTLDRLAQAHNVSLPSGEPEHEPLLRPDAFSNPVYSQFALKTLFAALICYLFYSGTDWQGIHTIMLSCVIVAQPGLGTTLQKSILRVGGAITGSLLALLAVIFIQPYTASITGLLLISLPVIASGAWIAAGSERISYAGTQLAFTFMLALAGSFGPVTDLTEIRDRIIGILLGVAVSTLFHLYLWPDSELPLLKKQLARLYRLLADHIHQGHDIMASPKLMQTIAQTNMLVSRVVLEQLHDTESRIHGKPSPPVEETLNKATLILQLINLCHARGWPDGQALTSCARMLTRYADHILALNLPESQTLMPVLKTSGGDALHVLAYTITTLPSWQLPHVKWMQDSQ